MNDLDLKPPPQPTASSVLFKPAREPSLICNVDRPTQWGLFAEGYKQAAERVFAEWKSRTGRPEYLVFPIVYLERHYLELRLKELLQSAPALLDASVNWQLDHHIPNLWKTLKPVLLQVESSLAKEESLLNAERLMLEFGNRDQRSMMFRYPENKNGGTHLRRS